HAGRLARLEGRGHGDQRRRAGRRVGAPLRRDHGRAVRARPGRARLDDHARRLTVADLLVRLYDLPPLAPALAAVETHGIEVRRALATERPQVTAFARAHASEGWAAECDAAFARMPLACFVAVERTDTLV